MPPPHYHRQNAQYACGPRGGPESIRYKCRMIRLRDEQWERIRMHFPEEHFARMRTPGPIVMSPHSVASGATQAVASTICAARGRSDGRMPTVLEFLKRLANRRWRNLQRNFNYIRVRSFIPTGAPMKSDS